ncbi:peptidoglycan-binding protein LysM [Actinobacillus seminis]|uniref:peptidoglycan-binding protein LysM n=1 Tax=Actinobacillus seminis TaxID=722 RepID=UPI003B94C70D
MSADIIDTLAVDIVANDSFTAVARPLLALFERLNQNLNRSKQALDGVNESADNLSESAKKLSDAKSEETKSQEENTKALERNEKQSQKNEKQAKKNEKVAKNLLDSILNFGKALGAITTLIMSGIGFDRLVKETARANQELDNISKNIGMTRKSLSMWQSAAEAMGGSANGITGTLTHLTSSLTRFSLMGDASIMPFFNALGVGVHDASGNIRNLEDIMLDLADKFSSMDRPKALVIAQGMRIDDETFNTLVQGREAYQKSLKESEKIYRASEKDVETAKKLSKAAIMLNRQFEGLKEMIANATMPVLIRISELVSKFFDFLTRNENLVKGVFMGFAGVMTAVLIPTLFKGAAAAWAFMAPFLPAILAVTTLAVAFGLLYDDYKKWADGGTSLLNWETFIGWISQAKPSVDNLKGAFADLLTGYEDWENAVSAAKSWLELKGFTENGEMSLKSLGNGFKNVAKDIYHALIPALDKVLNVINLLLDGEFSKAWEAAKALGNDMLDAAVETVGDNVIGDAAKYTGNVVKVGVNTIENVVNDTVKFWNGDISGSEYASRLWNSAGNFVQDNVNAGIDFVGNIFTGVGNATVRFVDKSFGIDPDKDPVSLTQQIKNNNLYDGEKGFKKKDFVFEGQQSAKGLTQEETGALAAQMVKRESGGNLRAENQYGYLGLYQFGAAALVDAGLIDDAKYRAAVRKHGEGLSNGSNADVHKAFLADSNNWTIKGGREAFLSNKAIQDNAIVVLMNKNVGYLGSTYQGSSEHKAGLLMAAHLKGAGGAKAFVNSGIDSSDGNGTKISDYYNTGRKAIQIVKQQGKSSQSESKPLDWNAPVGGFAVVEALNKSLMARQNIQNFAQPHNINNNQRTEVVINGGVNVNSGSSTIAGTAQDAVTGIKTSLTALQFNTGLV